MKGQFYIGRLTDVLKLIDFIIVYGRQSIYVSLQQLKQSFAFSNYYSE